MILPLKTTIVISQANNITMFVKIMILIITSEQHLNRIFKNEHSNAIIGVVNYVLNLNHVRHEIIMLVMYVASNVTTFVNLQLEAGASGNLIANIR